MRAGSGGIHSAEKRGETIPFAFLLLVWLKIIVAGIVREILGMMLAIS